MTECYGYFGVLLNTLYIPLLYLNFPVRKGAQLINSVCHDFQGGS